MDYFAGLDVSVKTTSVCIVDDTGKVVREVKVTSEPEALLSLLKNPAYHFKRIGLEAGPLSQWLFSGLAEAELPVVCVETRHMQAVLKAQINKTDRNDALGSLCIVFGITEIDENPVSHVTSQRRRRGVARSLQRHFLAGRNHFAQVFRVHTDGERRRTDQVRKHHCDLTALGVVAGSRIGTFKETGARFSPLVLVSDIFEKWLSHGGQKG